MAHSIAEYITHINVLREELTRLFANTKKRGVNNFSKRFLQERIATLRKVFEDVKTLHLEICNSMPASELPQSCYMKSNTYQLAVDVFEAAEMYLDEHLDRLDDASTPSIAVSSPGGSQGTSNNCPIKLPHINLPKFAGDYPSWPSFRDSFRSMVHESTSLPIMQKFHYLRSCVTGEAFAAIQNLPLTEENYYSAWKKLKEDYSNQRLLQSMLIKELLAVPKIRHDNLPSLKALRSASTVTLDALRNAGCEVNAWSPLLIQYFSDKFDEWMSDEWEKVLSDLKEFPEFSKFKDFIARRIKVLEARANSKGTTPRTTDKPIRVHTAETSRPKYLSCSKDHGLFQCPKFLALNSDGRYKFVQGAKLCLNCLRSGHSAGSCPSTNRCHTCTKPHHSLLHFPRKVSLTTQVKTSDTVEEPVISQVTTLISADEDRTVLLGTVMVEVRSQDGRALTVRGLVDNASQKSFITEKLAQRLRLLRSQTSSTVYGIGGIASCKAPSFAEVTLGSLKEDKASLNVNVLILPKVTSYTPPPYSTADFPQLQTLDLSDRSPSSKAPIDLLIGADYYPRVMTEQAMKSPDQTLIAQLTIFGWTVIGNVPDVEAIHSNCVQVHHCCNVDQAIRNFWEIEEVPKASTLSPEDQQCEDFFRSTVTQLPTGRFVVGLPFRQDFNPEQLGPSRSMADSALQRVLRRFKKSTPLQQNYDQFMHEYETLGHMSDVTKTANDLAARVYLPHHAVFKVENGKEKIRVVFNASAKTSSGLSLNDVLLTGPKLQKDITSILMNWRGHRLAGVADIVKMFRQILIREEDRKYQNILWTSDPQSPPQTFQLNTMTYGTGPTPFLASRVIQELALRHGNDFPDAQRILLESTYVDDLLFGADDLRQLSIIKDQLIQLLAKGELELSKWAFGSSAANLNESGITFTSSSVQFSDDSESQKILGISWNHTLDVFHFSITPSPLSVLTKRVLLSENAKIFDPTGWISLVTIILKQLMQSTWLLKISWDDPIPEPVRSKWLYQYQHLDEIKNITLPRWDGRIANSGHLELVGFCDASTLAYGAVVYARYIDDSGYVTVSQVMAKSKVAPVKPVPIPRMELLAAVLLTKLLLHIKSSLTSPVDKVLCFSDSQITLAWISQHSSKWKVFVANRVAYIQESCPEAQWRYVNTKENPADLNSRGLSPAQLRDSSLWWNGPNFLQEPSLDFLGKNLKIQLETSEESRITTHVATTAEPETFPLFTKASSWSRLVKVMVLVLRFISRTRLQSVSRQQHPSCTEYKVATQRIIQLVQNQVFKAELSALGKGQSLPRASALSSLSPFIEDGVLKVGGRLGNSILPITQKHPMIVPEGHVASLICHKAHLDTLHGGLQLTLATVRSRYWVINGRNLVKGVIHRCVICTREKARMGQELMGSLPASRVQKSSPFEHTGVDYAGPLLVKQHAGRNAKSVKAYVAVFVCMATRALHLELVSKYSTEEFLATLSRFIARRGKPAVIYSDNGTNFLGADSPDTTP